MTAFHEGRQWLSLDQVPAHVLDALEEDLDQVEGVEPAVPTTAPASPRAVQDRWQRVSGTVIDVVTTRGLTPAIRAVLMELDGVNLAHEFARRAAVMKTVPHFLRGPFRNALRGNG